MPALALGHSAATLYFLEQGSEFPLVKKLVSGWPASGQFSNSRPAKHSPLPEFGPAYLAAQRRHQVHRQTSTKSLWHPDQKLLETRDIVFVTTRVLSSESFGC